MSLRSKLVRLFFVLMAALALTVPTATTAEAAVTTHWSAWKWVNTNTGWEVRVLFTAYPAGSNYYRPTSYEVRWDGQSSWTVNYRSTRLFWNNLNTGDNLTVNNNRSTWKTGNGPYSTSVSLNQTLGYSNPQAYITLWTGTTAGSGFVGGVYIKP